ncbi:hypothetical protein DL95DRAFT_400431 [Leptodontidium sp. 2 PMI_412]|nr:hypothetical protein DL95DRAFT_400431 [Leptodontidium sp. 2 PMI_412]
MGLDDISDELLLEIVNFVKIGGCNRDLSHLSSCSQHLNRVTTPILYRDILQIGQQNLPSLLFTILKKPDLAEYVLRYESSEFEDGELDISGFSEEQLEMCHKSIKALKISKEDESEWFSRVQQGEWQALTTLLLLNLPKLKELDLASYRNFADFQDPKPDAGPLNFLFRKAAGRQTSGDKSAPSLSNLETVSVAYSGTEMGLGFEDVIPLLELPSVTSFVVHKLDGAIVGCMEFLPQTLGTGIQHLKHCLRSLEIFGDPEDTHDDERALAVGSLVDFEKLVDISTMQITLLGPSDGHGEDSEDDTKPIHLWNVLPKSLVRLTLIDCNPGIL